MEEQKHKALSELTLIKLHKMYMETFRKMTLCDRLNFMPLYFLHKKELRKISLEINKRKTCVNQK